MVRGAHSWYSKIACPLGGWPTNWKLIISQSFSHRSESSEPHVRLPNLGVWHRDEESLEHLVLKASGAWVQELNGTGGNRDSTLGGRTQGFTHTVTREKQWLHRTLGQTYLQIVEGLLRKQGLAVAHCVGKDTGGGGPREYSLMWALLEVTTLASRPGPTQHPAASSAGTPQPKQRTGWEHSPIHQQTGCLKSSWVHSYL